MLLSCSPITGADGEISPAYGGHKRECMQRKSRLLNSWVSNNFMSVWAWTVYTQTRMSALASREVVRVSEKVIHLERFIPFARGIHLKVKPLFGLSCRSETLMMELLVWISRKKRYLVGRGQSKPSLALKSHFSGAASLLRDQLLPTMGCNGYCFTLWISVLTIQNWK